MEQADTDTGNGATAEIYAFKHESIGFGASVSRQSELYYMQNSSGVNEEGERGNENVGCEIYTSWNKNRANKAMDMIQELCVEREVC